jgi:hypothetical protein
MGNPYAQLLMRPWENVRALLAIHKEVEWLRSVVRLHYKKQKHKGENSRVVIQLTTRGDGDQVVQGAHRRLGGR